MSRTSSPWKDLEPRPGDFDAELATIDPRYVVAHPGKRDATVRILLSVEGDAALRLARIAKERGQKPADVVEELLRDADRPAA